MTSAFPTGGTPASYHFSSAGSTTTFVTATTSNLYVNIWSSWVNNQVVISGTASSAVTSPQTYAFFNPPAMRSEEARRENEALIARKKKRLHDARRACRKAETLLLKHLSRPQRLTWINGDYFDFDVGNRTYRIRRGKVGNVELRDKHGLVSRLCCHPSDHIIGLPQADIAMSQWMMLKYNESGFLRLANVHWQRHDSLAA